MSLESRLKCNIEPRPASTCYFGLSDPAFHQKLWPVISMRDCAEVYVMAQNMVEVELISREKLPHGSAMQFRVLSGTRLPRFGHVRNTGPIALEVCRQPET